MVRQETLANAGVDDLVLGRVDARHENEIDPLAEDDLLETVPSGIRTVLSMLATDFIGVTKGIVELIAGLLKHFSKRLITNCAVEIAEQDNPLAACIAL